MFFSWNNVITISSSFKNIIQKLSFFQTPHLNVSVLKEFPAKNPVIISAIRRMTFWINWSEKKLFLPNTTWTQQGHTWVSYLFPEPDSHQLLLTRVTEQLEILHLVVQIALLSLWLLQLFPQMANIILSETKKDRIISLVQCVGNAESYKQTDLRLLECTGKLVGRLLLLLQGFGQLSDLYVSLFFLWVIWVIAAFQPCQFYIQTCDLGVLHKAGKWKENMCWFVSAA